jgi:Zn-finger domain-containing protein
LLDIGKYSPGERVLRIGFTQRTRVTLLDLLILRRLHDIINNYYKLYEWYIYDDTNLILPYVSPLRFLIEN